MDVDVDVDVIVDVIVDLDVGIWICGYCMCKARRHRRKRASHMPNARSHKYDKKKETALPAITVAQVQVKILSTRDHSPAWFTQLVHVSYLYVTARISPLHSTPLHSTPPHCTALQSSLV